LGNSNYPMVLIQVPMYNEREVNFQYWFFFNFNVMFILSLNLTFIYFSKCRFISYRSVLHVDSHGLLIESSYKFLMIQLIQQLR
jgi:hypothetical protein